MRAERLIGWLFCIALFAGLAPARADAGPVGQTIELEIADTPFELEYVADPESRRQGLMGRETLPPGTGMLFDFPAGTRPAIWMRNMLVRLDLVYIDGTGRIAQIFSDVPPCPAMPCEIYHARKPLRFVLEVPAGTVRSLGLTVGQKLPLADLIAQPIPQQ